MADTAYNFIYKQEFIEGYERSNSHFKSTVTTEAAFEGLTAYFLVATSNREAVTRGPNGLIPASSSDYTQPTVTLVEEHDKERGTTFKYFTGQADQRAIAQMSGRKVLNRAMDDKIIDALDTATVTAGASGAVFNKGLATEARVKLANANVGMDNQIFCAVTPAQWGLLEDDPSFANADYVEMKPLVMGMPNPQAEGVQMRNWLGVNWFASTALPGVGTATANCYMYHRGAVGYAYKEVTAAIGYDEEDDYYFARHSIIHGSTKLQNAGIIKMTLNDAVYS